MIFDSDIKKLISAAYGVQKDIFLSVQFNAAPDFFFDGVKTAVFLPGAFYPNIGDFADIRCAPENIYLCPAPDILFADIRFMRDEAFRSFLTHNRYKRLAALFAELADSAEYGFMHSYLWLGEYKAERADFCQLAAFFSRPCLNPEKFVRLYSAFGAVAAGEEPELKVRYKKADSSLTQFYLLACEAEKYSGSRAVIYFTTRLDEKNFAAFLRKRGTGFSCVSGALSPQEAEKEIAEFTSGENFLMLATKSFAASGFFIDIPHVLYCGAPYSLNHLARCCAGGSGKSVYIVFTETDFDKNERISQSYSELVEDKSVCESRRKNLFDIKSLLGC